MALETATLVSDLVITNPASGDPVSQADDHLRLVKSVLQNQFPDSSNGAIYGLRSGVSVASTSGTAIDFTGIPSWVKRITINLSIVSTTGGSVVIFQIGDSGGIENFGYSGSGSGAVNAGTWNIATFADGFGLQASSASDQISGTLTLTLLNASTNTWVASGVFGLANTAAVCVTGGVKLLTGTLDRVRITTSSGVPTFDGGNINIQYD